MAELAYRAAPGAVEIPDLPGWSPISPLFVGHFGALGGGHDETLALQAALTAAKTREISFLPNMVYGFGAPGLVLADGVRVNMNGAVLRVTDGAHEMPHNAAVRITGRDVRLHYGEFDFNYENQANRFNGLCGFDNSHDAILTELVLRRCPRRTLITNASSDRDPVVPAPRLSRGWRLSNIRIFDAQDKALQVRKSRDVRVTDCFCETNIQFPDDSSDSAFECSRSEHVQFINCTGVHRVRGYGPTFRSVNASRHVTFSGGSGHGGRQGLFCSDSKHVRFLDIVIQDTGKSGALIQASNLKKHPVWGETEDILVENCTFLNPSGDGIVVNLVAHGTHVKDVRLIGNYISSNAHTEMKYGLRNSEDTTGRGRIVQATQSRNTIYGASVQNILGVFAPLK